MPTHYYHRRRQIRLEDYDYSQEGFYFITICTYQRLFLFGEIQQGEMHLNTYGTIAHNCWKATGEIRRNITLADFIIMPNHMHAILSINQCVKKQDSSAKALDMDKQPTGVCNTPLQSPSQTIGSIIRGYKASVTKLINKTGYQQPIWQRNYYEHIIRTDESLASISEYILANPTTWEQDCHYLK